MEREREREEISRERGSETEKEVTSGYSSGKKQKQ